MAHMLELELKLEFEPGDRPRLEAAIAPKPGARPRHLVTTYFDTPSRDLLKAGYTLRVRQSGKRHVQTVKAVGAASAGLFERPEWEHPIAGEQPLFDARSGPIVRAMGARKLARLRPAFVTDVRRRTFRVAGADSDMEIAVDVGEIRSGELCEPLSEIEFEHRSGSIGQMFDLARRLNEVVPLRLGVRSKSERGYCLGADPHPHAFKAEPLSLDRDGDACDAFCAIAQACIRHFRLNEAVLLRSGDVEALHQARVALRRLRSAFSICKPLLGDDGKLALLNAELRWLAAELGEVRNIDVLIDHVDGEARDMLREIRDRAFARAQAELASARTRLLMIDLAEWLAVGAWRTTAGDCDLMRFAGARLDRLRKRLDHDGKGLAALDAPQRHKVRIEAKKLRYAAEFFASLYVSDKARQRRRRFVARLEKLQTFLGTLNDRVVGPELAVRHGIEIPPAKKSRRLRASAEQAHASLMRARPFW
ncbi:inorganic triphosphatase [Sphingomonas oligophenolica]|uniref:CHAD domain-containing protein n=1 Tax=Sphingomonas oligophenolica TaxID=301154 RepID=A0ABU9Y8F5_9SPHN